MARNLLQALGEGASKTASQAARGATRRALKDVPSSESIYKLGFGIGPMLRNTAESYKQQKEAADTAKTAKENLNFTKENVVVSKNMSTQLTALTSIMSDIRKISLAHLSIARMNAKLSGGRGPSFGDRSRYFDLERQLESVRGASLASTADSKEKQGTEGGLFGGLGLGKVAAGLLGLLALANAKEIGKFLNETGISDLVKEGTITAVRGLTSLLATTISEAITKGIPAILSSVSKDFSTLLEGLKTGDKTKTIQGGTGLATTAGGLAGAVYGFRKGRGVLGKLRGAAIGGALGYGIPAFVGDQAMESVNPSGKTAEERAANQQRASETIDQLGTLATLGIGGYSAYSLLKRGMGAAGKVASTATTAATTTMSGAGLTAEQIARAQKAEAAIKARQLAMEKDVAETMAKQGIKPAASTSGMFSKVMDLMAKISSKIGLKKLAGMIGARLGTAAAQGALAGAWGGPIAIITTLLRVGFEIWMIYELLQEIMDLVEKDEQVTKQDEAGKTGPASTTIPASQPSNATPATAPAGTSTAPQAAVAGVDYANPVPSGATGSAGRFGEERENGRLHTGVDISAPVGTDVRAIADGKVFVAGSKGSYGNMIEVHHNDGTVSRYAHLSEIGVRAGNVVEKGQIIGKVGSTGRSEAPHLHLELINREGKFVNPRDYIKGIPAYTGKDSGRNPEGSIASIDASGIATSISGTTVKPPSASDTFQSLFGFDPSKMGVNLNQMLSGNELKELNEIASAMNTQPQVMVVPQPAPQGSGQAPSVAPAPQRTPDNTQTKEKDYLWMMNSLSFGGPPPMIFP